MPEMHKLLQLTVVQYQVCYELLHGDNRKSQLMISQVTQVTKQGLDVVQAQHLMNTKISVVRYTVKNNKWQTHKNEKGKKRRLLSADP